MRQLRLDIDAAVASRRHRPLSVQRVRPLSQDEQRHPAATAQTAATSGQFHPQMLTLFIHYSSLPIYSFHFYHYYFCTFCLQHKFIFIYYYLLLCIAIHFFLLLLITIYYYDLFPFIIKY